MNGKSLTARLRASPTPLILEAADYIDGLIALHHRDSKELRRLCVARNEAHKEWDRLKDVLRRCARAIKTGRDEMEMCAIDPKTGCVDDQATRDALQRDDTLLAEAFAALGKD